MSNAAQPHRTSRISLGSAVAQRLTQPLVIVCQNINGVATKDEEVISAALRLKASIILLTESRLCSERRLYSGPRNEFRWFFGSNSPTTRGGVVAAFHRSLKGVHVVIRARNHMYFSLPTSRGVLYVGVVYLPPAGSTHAAERAEQLSQFSNIAAKLKLKGKLVILGDFNARMAANGDTKINIEGRQLSQLTTALGLTNANLSLQCKGQFTWERVVKGEIRRSTIDYALISTPSLLHSLHIISDPNLRSGSDHKPLVLQLTAPRPTTSLHTSPRLTAPSAPWVLPPFDDELWDIFRDKMEINLKGWREDLGWPEDGSVPAAPCSEEMLNLAASTFIDTVKQTADAVLPARSSQRFHAPMRLVTGSIAAAIEERNAGLALAQARGHKQDLLHYQQLCRRVRSLIRSRKRRLREIRFQKLEALPNGKDFWAEISKLSRAPGTSELPDTFQRRDGSLCKPCDRADTVREFFELLGAEAPASLDPIPPPQLETFGALGEEETKSVALLNEPIQPGEVKKAIAKLKCGKAVGPDGVCSELLKRGGHVLSLCFASLLSACWQSRIWPHLWSEGTICIIHKAGDTSNLNHYRPITVLNSVSKAAEYVLHHRLSTFVEQGHHLSDAQCGFRPSRRCGDNHFILSELLASRREQGCATYVVFVDLVKAYDSVWHTGLVAALRRADLTDNMLDVLQQLSFKVSRQARVDGDLSDSFRIYRGVPQGGVLSPLLFDLFINSLLVELESSGFGVTAADMNIPDLAFADDISLVAPDPSNMNGLLSVLLRHSKQWRYDVNILKCGVMISGTPSQESSAQSLRFFLGDQLIPVHQEYSYLGMCASTLRGKPANFVEDRIDSATAKLHMLSGSIGARFNGIRPTLSLQLWRSLILPGAEWGCEVTSPSPTLLKKMDSLLPAALRVFAGADSFTSNSALMFEFGAQSLSSRRQELQIRFFRHLCLADSTCRLGKLFRWRCLQVDHSVAPRSIVWTFKALLEKFGLQDIWTSRPNDAQDPLWESFESRVHEVAIRLDVSARKEAILARPTLSYLAQLKSLEMRSSSHYLSLRGLGPWLKLRMRSNSLPLLEMLGRYVRHGLPQGSSLCRMCDQGAVENLVHFVGECPALQAERHAFALKVRESESFMMLPGAMPFLDRWLDGDATTRTVMVLESVAVPCDPWEKKQWLSNRAERAHDDLITRFELLSMPFLINIWRRRALLLGGVPCLDITGSTLTMSHLREDGRCRSFAVGVSLS